MEFLEENNHRYLDTREVKSLLFMISPELSRAYDTLKKEYQDKISWACDSMELVNIFIYEYNYDDYLVEELKFDEDLSVSVDFDGWRFTLVALKDCKFYFVVEDISDL